MREVRKLCFYNKKKTLVKKQEFNCFIITGWARLVNFTF